MSMTYLSNDLYVEMIADGTIPKEVTLTRKRPTMLRPVPTTASFEEYARAELEDTGETLYAFRLDCPLDDEGNRWGDDDPVYVEVSWVDDDGYTVRLHTDPLKAAAALADGWGSMSWVMEYQDGEEDAGANLCAWGGHGLTIEQDTEGRYDITDDPRELGATAFSHLYARYIR